MENEETLEDRLKQLWADLCLGIPDEQREPHVKFAALQKRFEEIVKDVSWLEFRMEQLEY